MKVIRKPEKFGTLGIPFSQPGNVRRELATWDRYKCFNHHDHHPSAGPPAEKLGPNQAAAFFCIATQTTRMTCIAFHLGKTAEIGLNYWHFGDSLPTKMGNFWKFHLISSKGNYSSPMNDIEWWILMDLLFSIRIEATKIGPKNTSQHMHPADSSGICFVGIV